MTEPSSVFAVGDKVRVSDPNAPFYGSHGPITRDGRGMKTGPYKVWMVNVYGTAEVALYEKELTLDA